MSEPPNSQSPHSPEPEAQKSETTAGQVNQAVQADGNSFQASLKGQTIKFLRGTIRALEGVVVKLEAEPAPTTEPSWLDKLQVGWSAALAKIRSLLPENLSSKLSNTALTGIIAAIAVVLVWTTSALSSRKPPEVASVPSPGSEQPTEVANAPSPEPGKLPEEVTNVPSPEPETTPSIPTPPELTAPAEPQPVEVIPAPEPEPTPTPTVELTPEQTLIAAIENQVAQISDRFAAGLIQSIQANFEGSSLTIKVGDDWYNFKPSEQDKLATQMLEQARELDFSRLEITDPQGTLLARSPVVGKDMVIFKRV
jgi:hypothetical protein